MTLIGDEEVPNELRERAEELKSLGKNSYEKISEEMSDYALDLSQEKADPNSPEIDESGYKDKIERSKRNLESVVDKRREFRKKTYEAAGWVAERVADVLENTESSEVMEKIMGEANNYM